MFGCILHAGVFRDTLPETVPDILPETCRETNVAISTRHKFLKISFSDNTIYNYF